MRTPGHVRAEKAVNARRQERFDQAVIRNIAKSAINAHCFQVYKASVAHLVAKEVTGLRKIEPIPSSLSAIKLTGVRELPPPKL